MDGNPSLSAIAILGDRMVFIVVISVGIYEGEVADVAQCFGVT